MLLVLEGESLLVHCLPSANWHLGLTDLTAWILRIWLSMVGFVVAGGWILELALGWLVDTDLLAGLLGTVASLVAGWAPWIWLVLWFTSKSTINTFTVSALILHNVSVVPHLAVDDTWAWAGVALHGLSQILICAVALLDLSCSCPDTITACDRA